MRAVFAAALISACFAQGEDEPAPLQGCSLQSGIFNDYCTIELDIAKTDYPEIITDEDTCRAWAQEQGEQYGCDIAAGTGTPDLEAMGTTLNAAFPDLEGVFAALDLQ